MKVSLKSLLESLKSQVIRRLRNELPLNMRGLLLGLESEAFLPSFLRQTTRVEIRKNLKD